MSLSRTARKEMTSMKDDTISRAAAIDALAEWHDEAITNRLNNLPSAQPVEDASAMCGECDAWNQYKNYPHPGWIPCSERLPGDDEEVIVSCTDDSGDYDFDYTTVGWHYKGLWVVNNERSFLVRAWMPLPEPWKGERDG